LPGSVTATAAGTATSVVAGAGVVAGVEAGVVAGVVAVSPPAEPFDGSVPEDAVVVVVVPPGSAEFFKRVASGLDESELEPPHDATATRAIAKMAHLVTRDLI
jgi:hypothetical protein